MMEVHGKCKLENPCESFCLHPRRYGTKLSQRKSRVLRPDPSRLTIAKAGAFDGIS